MLSHYAVHTPLQGKPDKVAKYRKLAEQRPDSSPAQGKPEYAAMVESVDESVGKVMKTLEDIGVADHTLVILTSDNGGFARATSNAPLRGNKGSNFEGGIRVPLIIKWPGFSRPGSVTNEVVTSTDLYPTILAAASQPLQPYQHQDGLSLEPVFEKGGKLERDAIYWHYPHYNQHPDSFPCGVIRSGQWKLMENYDTGKLSLFDLANDLGETTDLASRKPEVTARLFEKLNQWKNEVGADPMRPNPQYMEAAPQ